MKRGCIWDTSIAVALRHGGSSPCAPGSVATSARVALQVTPLGSGGSPGVTPALAAAVSL